MPILDSYLFFNGNCAEAMKFYEKDAPGASGKSDKILHARLAFEGEMPTTFHGRASCRERFTLPSAPTKHRAVGR